jgi:selenocysteine-specific elongation factor
VDLLGASGVIALTKIDLVDDETLGRRIAEVRDRLAGTSLDEARIVACSAVAGTGLDDLRAALDELTSASVPARQADRPRLFVDRVFSIKGAGTVVTGTLVDGCVAAGEEIAVLPSAFRARIRSLQSHRRAVDGACPVSRVAMNLVGIAREELQRGDVIGRPGDWRPTRTIEVRLRPVRGLDHALTARGAYKLYVGSAETDARLRLLAVPSLEPGGVAYARIRTSRPIVADLFDPIVLREAGRAETVAGGHIVDVDPPGRPGPDPVGRLEARWNATLEQLPGLLANERGAVRVGDARLATGLMQIGEAANVGEWIVAPELMVRIQDDVAAHLGRYHANHPLREGAPIADVRTHIADALAAAGAPASPDLVEALISSLVGSGVLARSASSVRLADHRVTLAEGDVDRVLASLERGEPTPPSVPELLAAGVSRDAIDAAVRAESVVRVSTELVLRPEFVAACERQLRALAAEGTRITVSAFRETVGTSRKYAVPLLEYFDRRGITRREGDVRVLREH